MYEDRILVFVDILGFSDAINKTINDNGSENSSETNKINSLLDELKLYKEWEDETSSLVNSRKTVTHFSDTIVISFPIYEEAGVYYTLSEVLNFCITILNKNFLLRGAIVRGKVYHSPAKIFGPALVEAANKEKEAIYPRILVDDSIIPIAKKFSSRANTTKQEEQYVKDLLALDSDNKMYINYIGNIGHDVDIDYPYDYDYQMLEHFKKLKNIISIGFKTTDSSVLKKYCWLKKKYEEAVTKNIENIRICTNKTDIPQDLIDGYSNLL